jgi:hypothetical protein
VIVEYGKLTAKVCATTQNRTLLQISILPQGKNIVFQGSPGSIEWRKCLNVDLFKHLLMNSKLYQRYFIAISQLPHAPHFSVDALLRNFDAAFIIYKSHLIQRALFTFYQLIIVSSESRVSLHTLWRKGQYFNK